MRIYVRVHVGRSQHGYDPVALLEMDATEINILLYETRLGELHGRDEAEEFFDGRVAPTPVFLEPVA